MALLFHVSAAGTYIEKTPPLLGNECRATRKGSRVIVEIATAITPLI
jgi:hypothetical protein